MSAPASPDAALVELMADVVAKALDETLGRRLPRLTLSPDEAAAMLGISRPTLDRIRRAGHLADMPGARGRITLVSVLQFAGWPVTPAPLYGQLAPVDAPPQRGAA